MVIEAMPHKLNPMDEVNKEELAAEQAAVQVPKEEEVRADIITEYGFDEVDDAERIDKLVQKEIEQRTKFSALIGQKVKYRNEAAELRGKLEPEKKEDSPVTRDQELSTKDVLFLAKADIHEDDMDEVLDWAKFKKIPVSEAYKQLKATLDVRAEQRATANAANVSSVRRGPSKISDEVLIENASAGKLPESDAEIERLIAAKLKQK